GAGRYRERDCAAARRTVTHRAACARRARRVARVVEAEAEALKLWEGFDGRLRRVCVRVTDRADGAARVVELLHVAARARAVAERAHGCGHVRLAPVAEQARQARVHRVRVRELREVACCLLRRIE